MGVSKRKSVYIASEAEFSVDPDADGSSYRFVHASDAAPAPSYGEAIQRTIQDNTLNDPGILPGAQGGTVAFKTEVRGPGEDAAAGDGDTAVHGEMGLSIAKILGGVSLGAGTTFAAGWTTASGDVASAAGFAVGSVIYRVRASGRVEARPITVKVSNTITVEPAWSEAPAEDDGCYAMANYAVADSGHGTESIVVKGDGQEHLFTGCMGDLTIEALTARGHPRFAFSYVVDDVDHESAKASLPAADDDYPAGPIVKRAPCWIDGTLTDITEFTFALGNDRQPKLSTAGEQGRAGWVVVGQGRSATFKAYYATGLIDLYLNATKFPLFFFLANGVGNVIAVYIPAAQIVADPGIEDINGQTGQSLSIKATKPSTAGLPAVVISIG